ncbi:NADH-plastoquinone oxidoreductase subunit [compost metagenome]
MPENYIAMYNVPDKVTAEKIIKKSMPKILKIAGDIRDEIPFPVHTTKPSLKSGVVNTTFYKFFVKSKGFYTTEKCIGCKKCVQLCPLNNIEMKEDKPSWQNNCTHCMECISGCPTLAIEYKNKTQGKPRYYLECR